MAGQSLRARAEGGSEVTRADEPGPTLAQMIDRMRPEIQRALPKHMDADRVARIALTVLRQTPALARCTPESFLGALMTCSQLGLEPGPTGEAYLVPYGRVCTFIPGYQGLIKLMYQSGLIASVSAETVHERDHFVLHLGSNRRIEHQRPPLGEPRGEAVGWYALAKFKDDTDPAFVVLDRNEVEKIRARSKAGKDGPWVSDYDAMAKKTCVRQLSKWVPKSPELRAALVQDGGVRTDASLPALEAAPDSYVDGELVAGDDPPAGVDPDTGLIADSEPGQQGWPEVAKPADTQ
jgi:recombination protein RecT